jgi:hypothetical protein
MLNYLSILRYTTGFGLFKGRVREINIVDNEGEMIYTVEYVDGDEEYYEWAAFVEAFNLNLKSKKKPKQKKIGAAKAKVNPKQEMTQAAVRDAEKTTVAGKQLLAMNNDGRTAVVDVLDKTLTKEINKTVKAAVIYAKNNWPSLSCWLSLSCLVVSWHTACHLVLGVEMASRKLKTIQDLR